MTNTLLARLRPSERRFQIPTDIFQTWFAGCTIFNVKTGEEMECTKSPAGKKEDGKPIDNHIRNKVKCGKIFDNNEIPMGMFKKDSPKIFFEELNGRLDTEQFDLIYDGLNTGHTTQSIANIDRASLWRFLPDIAGVPAVSIPVPRDEPYGGDLTYPKFVVDTTDYRPTVTTTKKKREKPDDFRETQMRRFGGRCPISGVTDKCLLAAGHMVYYLGIASNHPHNGILFFVPFNILWGNNSDKSVKMAIHPDTLIVHIHPSVEWAKPYHGKKFEIPSNIIVSPDALRFHWNRFVKNGGCPHGPYQASGLLRGRSIPFHSDALVNAPLSARQ